MELKGLGNTQVENFKEKTHMKFGMAKFEGR